MKKVIFCIITIPNTAITYVVTSEESEKQNIDQAMEKDGVVTERIEVETDRTPRSFLKEALAMTGNSLFGYKGGLYGDLPTEEIRDAFKALAEGLKQNTLQAQ